MMEIQLRRSGGLLFPLLRRSHSDISRGFTHLDGRGEARMVDVGDKPETRRTATAFARVSLGREIFDKLVPGGGISAKGDVLGVARIAGIQAAKSTHSLIPLCHAVPLSSVHVDFTFLEEQAAVGITTRATTQAVSIITSRFAISSSIALPYVRC